VHNKAELVVKLRMETDRIMSNNNMDKQADSLERALPIIQLVFEIFIILVSIMLPVFFGFYQATRRKFNLTIINSSGFQVTYALMFKSNPGELLHVTGNDLLGGQNSSLHTYGVVESQAVLIREFKLDFYRQFIAGSVLYMVCYQNTANQDLTSRREEQSGYMTAIVTAMNTWDVSFHTFDIAETGITKDGVFSAVWRPVDIQQQPKTHALYERVLRLYRLNNRADERTNTRTIPQTCESENLVGQDSPVR